MKCNIVDGVFLSMNVTPTMSGIIRREA